jgi:hypothetical protein
MRTRLEVRSVHRGPKNSLITVKSLEPVAHRAYVRRQTMTFAYDGLNRQVIWKVA